ncbi:MAG: 4Fe-4S binding protein [Chloroflexi bacterium]|nr:4Fe-4S binding protein [Chloroflexota bacterium]MBC7317155.1 4Fe-4S binding protein [Chloroflexota bacterium]
MIYIDERRCTGCGACIEACPAGALQIKNGLAHIDQERCRECEACVGACPQKAILAVSEPVVAERPIPIASPARVPDARLASKALPWLGTALLFVGREILPRAVASLWAAAERRLGGSALQNPTLGAGLGNGLRGSHRHRFRGGRR